MLVAGLMTGCVPLGSKLGKEEVVASRLGPHGGVTERIVGVPTEHHWMLLVAPDGPELNYILSETWRFYLVGADGQREYLHFLKKRGGNVVPWNLIAPISHTNLWVAMIETGSLKRVEQSHYDSRVICFDAKGIISEGALDYPEYGTFHFDSESHILTYKMKDRSRSYDPLAKTR
jgi:hypothetical protein